jgi:3-oxoacyl-[acyl-carrier-protein] synthase II
MERALESARVAADVVDYINAHGTATPFNDATEGKAIGQLFGRVPVSSTKSMMGHSLGAAGAIEAVVCLLALQHQFLPPNINFRAPDEDADLNIVANESRSASVRTVLSNSFGFGGTNASIVMQQFKT